MPWLAILALGLASLAFITAIGLLVRGALYRPRRPLILVVAERRDHVSDLFTIRLRRTWIWRWLPLPRFVAGQSVAVSFPGETLKRRYSIARWQALPFSYELTIKREAYGRLSSRLADEARCGTRLAVGRPDGRFSLPSNPAAHRAIFIAGGVGITPLLAMLDQWASMRHSYSEAHLYWQVRHEQEAIYRDVLLMLTKRSPALQVRLLVSRPQQGHPERISVELLRAELGAFSHTDFYLCAGTGLLESLLAGLRAAGIADAALHFERFALGPADTAQDWSIHYQDRQFSAAGHASLLDAIESQGLPIDSDCRTGSCGRCLLAVEDGQAKHRVVPECVVAPGQVLACCAVPLSDVRLRAATNVVTAMGA
ncbi:MAG: 2Fe-2S iron-sulfur cluster-binding protein [Rhodocyclaceae bacterium]